jgi:hypothetical protein
MSDIFLLKLALSFIVGGAAVSLSIILSERLGPKAGGVMLGLPIMSALGIFFIGFTQSAETAAAAATIIPVTLASGLLFLLAFLASFEKLGLWKSLALGLAIFACVSSAFPLLGMGNIYVNTLFYIAVAAFTVFAVKDFKVKKVSYNPKKREVLMRGMLGGFITACAVVAAMSLGPQWGGIVAAIPASYITALIIVTRTHGVKFAKSIIRNVPLGTAGTLVYAIAVHSAYPQYGIFAGTLIGYGLAAAFVILAGFSITRMKRL